jgi:protease-4
MESISKRVPVVVSMGGIAASGGYYIAAGAKRIYAEPTTTTGSIGVIAAWPVLKGAMDKLGVEVVTLRSDHARQWKARENFWEPPGDMVRQEVVDLLNSMQDRFEAVVRQGRGDRLKLIPAPTSGPETQPAGGPAPFNGKVYLAAQAKELGLVDEVGYFDDAVKAARDEAGLGNEAKVVQYGAPRGLLEALTGGKVVGGVNVDSKALHELTSPQLMMIWKLD